MHRLMVLLIAGAALPAMATTPPPDASFDEMVCRADTVVVGTASDFKVVGLADCTNHGDGHHLTMCEEVEVRVKSERVVRSKLRVVPTSFTFHFGGGLFNVDQLRKDLLAGPRYFFLAAPSVGANPVFRTSYPWFLGAPDNPVNASAVQRALAACPAPNSSCMDSSCK